MDERFPDYAEDCPIQDPDPDALVYLDLDQERQESAPPSVTSPSHLSGFEVIDSDTVAGCYKATINAELGTGRHVYAPDILLGIGSLLRVWKGDDSFIREIDRLIFRREMETDCRMLMHEGPDHSRVLRRLAQERGEAALVLAGALTTRQGKEIGFHMYETDQIITAVTGTRNPFSQDIARNFYRGPQEMEGGWYGFSLSSLSEFSGEAYEYHTEENSAVLTHMVLDLFIHAFYETQIYQGGRESLRRFVLTGLNDLQIPNPGVVTGGNGSQILIKPAGDPSKPGIFSYEVLFLDGHRRRAGGGTIKLLFIDSHGA